MKDHAPNSSLLMFLVSNSVKTSPVNRLRICDAKITKPE